MAENTEEEHLDSTAIPLQKTFARQEINRLKNLNQQIVRLMASIKQKYSLD